MSLDYIVASLPSLTFGAKAPLSREAFAALIGGEAAREKLLAPFHDLETQIKNAIAFARTGANDYARPADGCSLYWRDRVLKCFAEKDVAARDELIDRVWWDAAGEMASPIDPLGKGALLAYAIRLDIALRRDKISSVAGRESFDRLTAETKVNFP